MWIAVARHNFKWLKLKLILKYENANSLNLPGGRGARRMMWQGQVEEET